MRGSVPDRHAAPHRPPAGSPPPLEPFAGLPGPLVPLRSRRRRVEAEFRHRRRRLRRRLAPWLRVLREAVVDFFTGDSPIHAGYVAFATLFAVFPFLIFLVTLAGLLGQTQAVRGTIELALELIPPEVAAVLRPAVEEVIRQASAGVLTVSALVSVWFASSGLESLRHALNHAHKVPEPPHFLVGRLQSILLTLVSGLAVLVVTVALVGWPLARDLLAWLSQQPVFERGLDVAVRYAVGLGLLFALTVALYLLLPAVELRLRDVWPGALFVVVAWTLAAWAFSWYLRTFARYSLIYGSLAGIVLTLFFFYISAGIFIFGAELNSAILRERLRRMRERAGTVVAAPPGDGADRSPRSDTEPETP